jgi:hypothetical protein
MIFIYIYDIYGHLETMSEHFKGSRELGVNGIERLVNPLTKFAAQPPCTHVHQS